MGDEDASTRALSTICVEGVKSLMSDRLSNTSFNSGHTGSVWVNDPGLGTRDPGLGIRDSGLGIRDSGGEGFGRMPRWSRVPSLYDARREGVLRSGAGTTGC